MSSAKLVSSGRTTPKGNYIGVVNADIYDNEQRKADHKNNMAKSNDVASVTAKTQTTTAATKNAYDVFKTGNDALDGGNVQKTGGSNSGGGLSFISGNGGYSAPSIQSTVDPFYTGINNNHQESWNDDNIRTSVGEIDSGLGEEIYGAIKPVVQTVKKGYDKVNNFVDVSDLVSLPYTMMTDGTRFDDDYYLTEKEKETRDSLGYKEFAGISFGKGNEYMESLKGEIEERKAQELTKTINNSNSDLMKYIGSFLVNAGAGGVEGVNNIKNAFYSLTGEGQTAPKSALSITAENTRGNLGKVDTLLADGLKYTASKAIPTVVASGNPVLGKVLYGINDAGQGYGRAIEQGAESYEAFATGVGEGALGLAMEVGFGNVNGVASAMNPVKDKVADKVLETVKLVVKDENVAKKLSNLAATAFMSVTGTELEVNAERYLRNVYLGENNEISFTDPRTLEEVAVNLVIDEVFELADRGEIELKSGSDLENSWEKGYDEGDTIDVNKKYKPETLMIELAESGVKYNKDEVVSVKKDTNGKLLWLEQGNDVSGLKHIIENHKYNFGSRGVYDVVEFMNDILETEPLKTNRTQRGLFSEYSMNGKNYRVVYGTNGYIVSFYPID